MYCDMHGHSMRKNVFMYACNYRGSGFGIEDGKTNIFIRLLPFLLSKRNRLFSYEDSHFRLERFKEATARIVNFKEFNILASYTLEASFFGPELFEAGADSEDNHMDTAQLESLGRDLCKQLMIFISPREFRIKLQELSNYLNPPKTPFIKKRAASARRKETFREEMGEALPDTGEFNVKEAIEEIPEENFEGLCMPEDKSQSGGSDSEASDNDEKKICYLLEKMKKRKKSKKHEKHKSQHICQNSIPSTKRIRNSSLTPEFIIKSRSKSKISSIKSSFNNLCVKSTVKKTLLKSPYVEEIRETFNNLSSIESKPFIEKQKKIREATPVITRRGANGFFISSMQNESCESSRFRPFQKLNEKGFKMINLRK